MQSQLRCHDDEQYTQQSSQAGSLSMSAMLKEDQLVPVDALDGSNSDVTES